MTKNHICAKNFLEIIGFSKKFKESMTDLNVSKKLKNVSGSKNKSRINNTFWEKTFQKVLNVSCFSRKKPIIWETFGVLFAKGIDITRLYHTLSIWLEM